ncbi:MAG TPA: sodium-dependent transporter [Xanthomonadales bacterium]|nr:sodium-dependent transporter [Xanthomonadales bacterium]
MTAFKQHDNWTSRTSFLLAAIGAAVGLGNIWKFPYITGANGGSAFVLVYLLVILFVALPILIAEITLGRMGKQSPPRSLFLVARRFGSSGRWSIVGWLGILAAYLIGTYYSVIAGWTLAYIFKAGNGSFTGQDTAAISAQFSALQSDPWLLTAWHAVFMGITTSILYRGLKKGIEKANRILMPALFGLLLLMVAYSAVEGDMAAGLRFLFAFDLSAVTGKVVLMAIGHAFFSIGVAMGLMLGFGAYLGQDISIARSAVIIAGADTLVALLAGIAIFPIVFANGLDPGEGPGLVFVSLPIAFGQMTGGVLFGALFFLLLFFAALTSMIGVLEPITAWVEEVTRLKRGPAANLVCVTIFVLGLGTVFSFNIWLGWYPLGFIERFSSAGFFAVLDYLTANIMMPLGGLLLALFAGWRLPKTALAEELRLARPWHFQLFLWLLRLVAPLSIAAIFVANL